MKQQTVSLWEKGRLLPEIPDCLALGRALGLETDDLIGALVTSLEQEDDDPSAALNRMEVRISRLESAQLTYFAMIHFEAPELTTDAE